MTDQKRKELINKLNEEMEAAERTMYQERVKTALYISIIATVLVGSLLFAALAWNEESRKEEVDGMVYTFMVAKVEGNDDLLADLLLEEAQGILKPGRHAFPGAAEEMGQRYEIIRYENEYENGAMFYELKFFRPSTNFINRYDVMVINTPDGWRIAEIGSIDKEIMQAGKKDEEGRVIHEYGGAN